MVNLTVYEGVANYTHEFRTKWADSSVRILHAVWVGGIDSELHEAENSCSWTARGSVTRLLRLNDDGQQIMWPVHPGKDLSVVNSRQGSFMDCARSFEGDVSTIRQDVKDRLPLAVASDLPAVKKWIESLPNIVDVN